MEERDVVLQLHGEATGDDVDPYDRESVFIERELAPLVARHPRLRIVLEHVTTRAGVEFVRAAAPRIAATITPQHLLLNRGAMFAGGLRPHLYCLPVLKRERDREALIEAATSGDPRFFLGTDSAPHAQGAKESVLRLRRRLLGAGRDRALCARFRTGGPARPPRGIRELPRRRFLRPAAQRGTVMLERRAWTVPASSAVRRGEVVPMGAGRAARVEAAGRRVAMNAASPLMRDRFRGFLPVVVDVETGGFIAATDALLEIAAVLIAIDPDGRLVRGPTHRQHVRPFEGGRLDPASLAVNGIDP